MRIIMVPLITKYARAWGKEKKGERRRKLTVRQILGDFHVDFDKG